MASTTEATLAILDALGLQEEARRFQEYEAAREEARLRRKAKAHRTLALTSEPSEGPARFLAR